MLAACCSACIIIPEVQFALALRPVVLMVGPEDGPLTNGRPKSFWLTGFFNAQGFLTSVQQEVTRRHSGWSLDDVIPYSEMTPFEKEDVDSD